MKPNLPPRMSDRTGTGIPEKSGLAGGLTGAAYAFADDIAINSTHKKTPRVCILIFIAAGMCRTVAPIGLSSCQVKRSQKKSGNASITDGE